MACFMAFGTFLPFGRARFILFVYPITSGTAEPTENSWDAYHAHFEGVFLQNLVFLSFDVFHPNAGFLTGPQLEI